MDWSLFTEDERREFLALYHQPDGTDLDQLFQYAVRRGGPFTVPVADLYTAMLLKNSPHQLGTYNRSDLVNMTSADISHFENLFELDSGNARNKNRIMRILRFAGLIELNLALTGVRDTDSLILSHLDDDNLITACQSNVYVSRLCQDIWLNRLIETYGKDVLNFKEDNVSVRDFYLRLRKYPVSRRSAVAAALNGHLDVLKWLETQGVLLEPNLSQFPVVWMGGIDENAYERIPTAVVVSEATVRGHLDVLRWFVSKGLEKFQNISMGDAIANGHLNIVEWLYNNGVMPDRRYHPNQAAENGHLDILKWLSNLGMLPDSWGASRAERRGHTDVVRWLATKGIYP